MWCGGSAVSSAILWPYHLSKYLRWGPESMWRKNLSTTYMSWTSLSAFLRPSSESVSNLGSCCVGPFGSCQWGREVEPNVARWMETMFPTLSCRICSKVASTPITLKGPCFLGNRFCTLVRTNVPQPSRTVKTCPERCSHQPKR